MVKFQQTAVLHRLLLKWACSRPVNLWMNYHLQTSLHVKNWNWFYFIFCISPERWKGISGNCSLVLVNIFCFCSKANRCLIGKLTFRYPKQNSQFPTQISSSHSPLHLRKWWFHSSSCSVNKSLASSSTCFLLSHLKFKSTANHFGSTLWGYLGPNHFSSPQLPPPCPSRHLLLPGLLQYLICIPVQL